MNKDIAKEKSASCGTGIQPVEMSTTTQLAQPVDKQKPSASKKARMLATHTHAGASKSEENSSTPLRVA